jgi:holliday junction DNA helicase RuvB
MPYGEAEISAIVTRAAARDELPIDADAANAIASVSRGAARHAIGLLKRVRDEVVAEDGAGIDREAVSRALAAAGIGEDGLSTLERKALDALAAHGRPMGIARWAAAAGLSGAVLRRLCEPELTRQGLVWVTARGRMARARAQLRAVARAGVRYDAIPESAGAAGELCRDRAAG